MSFERPKSAIGWDDSTVQVFPAGQAFVAEVHGCMVGMTGNEGMAIFKPWYFYCLSPVLCGVLNKILSSRDHAHAKCEVQSTKRSGSNSLALARKYIKGIRAAVAALADWVNASSLPLFPASNNASATLVCPLGTSYAKVDEVPDASRDDVGLFVSACLAAQAANKQTPNIQQDHRSKSQSPMFAFLPRQCQSGARTHGG